MDSNPALPVLAYATGSGWHTVGTATSLAAARRVVRRQLSAQAGVLVARCGFKLSVFRRTALQRELNGGPDGYVWSVGK